jgi:hypothetical protein
MLSQLVLAGQLTAWVLDGADWTARAMAIDETRASRK